MEKTPIQRRIEMSVTNGIGYDSQTQFIEGRWEKLGYLEKINAWLFVDEEDIKNSKEGLSAHLADLQSKTRLPLLRRYYHYLKNNSEDAKEKFNIGFIRYHLRLLCAENFIKYHEHLSDEMRSIAIYSAVSFKSIFNLNKYFRELPIIFSMQSLPTKTRIL